MLYLFCNGFKRCFVGLAPLGLLEVWGVFVHFKVNELYVLIPYLPLYILLFLRNLFFQTLHKIFEKLCLFTCYTLYHWSAVFKSCKTIWASFGNIYCGDLLPWRMSYVLWLGSGVGTVAVLAHFSSSCLSCFVSYLDFGFRIFPVPLSFVISSVGSGVAGSPMWHWGFSPQTRQVVFLLGKPQLRSLFCWFLGDWEWIVISGHVL